MSRDNVTIHRLNPEQPTREADLSASACSPLSYKSYYTSYYTEQDAARKTALIQKKAAADGFLSDSDSRELEELKKRSAKRRDELAPFEVPYFLENAVESSNLFDDFESIVCEALQDSWNDFVNDTGCIPECFEISSDCTMIAHFDQSNFGNQVAGFIEAVLLRRIQSNE